MNEQLKRRFTGLALIIFVLFLISWVLPKPGEMLPDGENVQRVTLDLKASETIADAPSLTATLAPAPVEVLSHVESAVTEKVVNTPEPDIEEVPSSELISKVSSGSVVTASPTAKPPVKKPLNAITTPQVSAPKAAPKSAEPHWYVQLGAFSEVGNARQLLERFKAQKYSGFLSPADTSKGTRYRVRIGPYAKREQAMGAQKRMIQAGTTGTTLVEE